MYNWRLWLKWSWRDLRARWLQVFAIALIIALGTGVFAGLGGEKSWVVNSYEGSYDLLNMYDVRIALAKGSFIDQQQVLEALSNVAGIEALEPRLITSALVDASHDDQTIVVRGELVGVDVHNDGPQVSRVYVPKGHGRTLNEADAGQPTAVVEYKFAKYYNLQPGSPLKLSGDGALEFVGSGFAPEYLLLMPDAASSASMGMGAESSFAVLFMSLETVQQISGHEGMVNDLVLRVKPGADRAAVQSAVEQRLTQAFPEVGLTISTRDDDPARKMMYADAEGDQQSWNMIAILFLLGAALGAFNLAGRIVAAQRRQIGVGMALGVPRHWIAFRPMLMGLQIAAIGTLLGVVAGTLLSHVFGQFMAEVLPFPYWDVSLYMPAVVRGAVGGVLLPVLATLIPVWRAVRVQPIDAIRTGHLVAKGGGLNWLASRLPIPGGSFMHMPFRNLLRAPWRTVFTVIGVSVAIMLMVAFVGFLDTFLATRDRIEVSSRYMGANRVFVYLDFFYPQQGEVVTSLENLTDADGHSLARAADPMIVVDATLSKDDTAIDIMLPLYDPQSNIWVPKLIAGTRESDEAGLLLSEKIADDLGVWVGDTVTMKHPVRTGLFAFKMENSDLPVLGIHDNPMRTLVYMDIAHADVMGLGAMANVVVLDPAKGVTLDTIKQALLGHHGVASVVGIEEFSKASENMLELFVKFLRVVRVVVLFMAFLVAFNTASINVDERVREIATMFAFGVPIRTVTRMQVVESLIVGVLGTLVGAVWGWAVLVYLSKTIEDQIAQVKFIIHISPETLIVSSLLGILVVGLTPLVNVRRMRRMDIPSTLRVME